MGGPSRLLCDFSFILLMVPVTLHVRPPCAPSVCPALRSGGFHMQTVCVMVKLVAILVQ